MGGHLTTPVLVIYEKHTSKGAAKKEKNNLKLTWS